MQMIKGSSVSKLALGCLLALGVSHAQASTITPQEWTSSSNASDLGLMVWDQTAATSYAVDLNISLLSFIAQEATTNMTWNLDSIFTSFAATGDQLAFNIAAANYGTPNPSYIYQDPNDTLLYSYQTGETGLNYYATTLKQAQILGDQNKIVGEFITQQGGAGSEVVTSNSAAYYGSSFWGNGQGNSIPNHSTVYGGSGTNSLSLALYTSPGASTVSGTAFNLTLPSGTFSLSQVSGSYLLSYSDGVISSSSTSVPEPAEIGLFLTGLASLLGLRKRNSVSRV